MLEDEFLLYEGIVIQNNDPDKMGRVKVFIPGITNTIYDNWNNIIEDITFSSIDEDLIPIMEQLKEDLPWANQAQMLFGGDNDHAYYNNSKNYKNRPADSLNPTDSFSKSYYTPAKYSRKCAGQFSIPVVGSHVYVFFRLGNTNYPIYFASAAAKNDWNGIFNNDNENYPSDDGSNYTNKHLLNTLKHSLEFIDTDENEKINLTHYSGSNIQFLNDYVSKYCVKDEYSLIEDNKYETIGKNVKLDVGESINITVGNGSTIVVNGDGSINVSANTSLNITTPQTTINGNLTVVGNILGIQVSDAIRSMAGDRIIYNSHTHSQVASIGTPTPPNQPQ